jgi:hypothetical protein
VMSVGWPGGQWFVSMSRDSRDGQRQCMAIALVFSIASRRIR